MAMWFVLGMLAAFGALSGLWALFGVLVAPKRGAAVVCFDADALRHHRRLKEMGLIRCPILWVDDPDGEIEKWAEERKELG